MSAPVDYAALTEKRCSKCEQVKPVEAFNKYDDPTAKLTGWRYYSWCRECSNERAREYGKNNRKARNARVRKWRRNNPEAAAEKSKRAKLARVGLTPETHQEAIARHDGMCWLCLVRPGVAADHDHDLGHFRGMLCHGCNSVVMARVDADPDFLERVEQYVLLFKPDVPTPADFVEDARARLANA